MQHIYDPKESVLHTDDLLREIFVLLDSNSVLIASFVCRKWKGILKQWIFWKLYCLRYFPIMKEIKNVKDDSWKKWALYSRKNYIPRKQRKKIKPKRKLNYKGDPSKFSSDLILQKFYDGIFDRFCDGIFDKSYNGILDEKELNTIESMKEFVKFRRTKFNGKIFSFLSLTGEVYYIEKSFQFSNDYSIYHFNIYNSDTHKKFSECQISLFEISRVTYHDYSYINTYYNVIDVLNLLGVSYFNDKMKNLYLLLYCTHNDI